VSALIREDAARMCESAAGEALIVRLFEARSDGERLGRSLVSGAILQITASTFKKQRAQAAERCNYEGMP